MMGGCIVHLCIVQVVGLNRDAIMRITLTGAVEFQLLRLDPVVQTYVPLAFAVVHIAWAQIWAEPAGSRERACESICGLR